MPPLNDTTQPLHKSPQMSGDGMSHVLESCVESDDVEKVRQEVVACLTHAIRVLTDGERSEIQLSMTFVADMLRAVSDTIEECMSSIGTKQ
jgi:hypothetical protein